MEDTLISTGKAGRICGVSNLTVRRWYRRGTVQGSRLSPTCDYRISRSDLERLAAEREAVLSSPRLMDVHAAARMCGRSKQTIYRWIYEGIIKGVRVPGSNRRRVLNADLERLLAERINPS